MPRLVTQLVDEQPTVLVIASHPIPAEIMAGWSRSDVSLELATPEKCLQDADRLLTTAYRVLFWLPSILVGDPQLDQLVNIARLVEKKQLQLIVVSTLHTSITDTRQEWLDWHQASQDQLRSWHELTTLLPRVKWVVGQDVIGKNMPQWQPSVSMLLALDQASLLDPHISVFPQKLSGFWKAVFSLILDPTTTSCVLQGKQISTTTLLQHLKLTYNRHHGRSINLETIATKLLPIVDFSVITLAMTFVSEEEVVEYSLASLPTSFQTNSTSSSTKKAPVTIPPHPMPRVNYVPPIKAADATTMHQRQIDSEVKALFQDRRAERKVQRTEVLTQKAKKTIRKTQHRKKVFWGGVAAGMAGVVVLAIFGLFWVTSQTVERQLAQTFTQTEFQRVMGLSTDGVAPRVPGKLAASILSAQIKAAELVLASDALSQPLATAQSSTYLHEFIDSRNQLDTLSAEIMAALQSTNGKNQVAERVASLAGISHTAYEQLAEFETALTAMDFTQFETVSGGMESQMKTVLSEAKRQLTTAQLLQPLWPRLLGLEGKRTYAVLWQNSLELRPTGGFIQAVGFVDMDGGTIQVSQVMSSYQVDQQLPGEVLAPEDLKQYLGEQQWFFRDSNWNADFARSAMQANKFLPKIANRHVDGVIGLTIPSVKAILEVVGPLHLPDFQETVTADSLEQQIEQHTALPTAAKGDFQTAVLSALLTKLHQVDSTQSPTLLRVLSQQLNKGQLLVFMTNADEEATFHTLGWSGALLQPLCPTQLSTAQCQIDALAQVETNVGVNLANSTVQRQVAHSVTLGEDGAVHSHQITFTNAATTRVWPRGDYKAYLRLYLPTNAILGSVSINNQKMPSESVTNQTDKNNQVWGFPVTVPIKQQTVVMVTYTTPLPRMVYDTTSGAFSYGLYSQYQPGVDPVITTSTIHFPASWSPALVAPTASVSTDQLQFISNPALQTLQAVQFDIQE